MNEVIGGGVVRVGDSPWLLKYLQQWVTWVAVDRMFLDPCWKKPGPWFLHWTGEIGEMWCPLEVAVCSVVTVGKSTPCPPN